MATKIRPEIKIESNEDIAEPMKIQPEKHKIQVIKFTTTSVKKYECFVCDQILLTENSLEEHYAKIHQISENSKSTEDCKFNENLTFDVIPENSKFENPSIEVPNGPLF